MSDLTAALVAARLKMTDPKLSGTNPHFGSKFVPRDSVLEAIIPALLQEGVFLTQGVSEGALLTVVQKGDEVDVLCEYPIPTYTDPQKYLAALTYASRGSLMLAFALAGEPDDDGNTAARAQPQVEAKPQAAIEGDPTGFDAILQTAVKMKTGKAVRLALGLSEAATVDECRKAYDSAKKSIKAAAAVAALGGEEQ